MLPLFLKIKYLLKYNKLVTLNQEISDCGVACLSSVLKYYGITTSLVSLRSLSGTTKTGTSVLGICQAGSAFNIEMKAVRINSRNLSLLEKPCILLVSLSPNRNHYMVFLEKINNTYVLIDPEAGIVLYNEQKLLEIWQSGILVKVNHVKQQTQGYSNSKGSSNKWLKDILVVKKYAIIGSVLLVLISTILNVSVYVFFQRVIDNIIPQNNLDKLISVSVFLLIILFARSIIILIKNRLNNKILTDLNIKIMEHFTDVFFLLPKLFFSNRKTGELVARFNDSLKVQESIAYFLNESVKNILSIILSMAIIFFFSIKIGLIILTLVPLLYFVSIFYSNKIKNKQQNVMITNAIRTGTLVNLIQGIDYIKISNHENDFSNLYMQRFKSYQKNIYNMTNLNSYLYSNLDMIIGIFSILILLLCSLLVFKSEMQLGQLMAIFFLFIGITPSIISLPFNNVQYKNMKVAANKINELTHLHPKKKKNDIDIGSFDELIFNNVMFFYPGSRAIIENISFRIKKNEFVCFIGESGIGKTTLINLIIGFYSPTSGSVYINSNDSNNINLKKWISKIGFVEQNIPIFNGSVYFNICLDEKSNIEDVVGFCKENGFHELISGLPNQYYTQLGDNGIELSNGQKQLIGIARALYKKPEILILDEPSSALDYMTDQIILDILKKFKGKVTIILVTHRFNLTFMSDNIYIIEKGRIRCSGSHLELLSTDNFYSRYFNLTVKGVQC